MDTTTNAAAFPHVDTPAGRYDLYADIHKALRLMMTRALCQVGSADPDDGGEVADALDLVGRLLGLCEAHLHHENAFIHPALERARPGSTARVAAEHVHHAEAIADVRELAALVAGSAEGTRAGALGRLYRALALFVADNLQHMHVEETAHNALLWAAYRDDEIAAIEHAIVAALPPATKFESLNWFIPALNASERAGMLAGMRQAMPAEAFRAVLDVAQRTLSPRDHARLMRALGPAAAPVAAAA